MWRLFGRLELRETGYAMPLELWVQAVAHQLRIVELPVPLIYLEEERSFGGMLDDGDTRLRYYHEVLRAQHAISGHADADIETCSAIHPTCRGGADERDCQSHCVPAPASSSADGASVV